MVGFIKSTGKDGKSYYFKYELENQPSRAVPKVCFKTKFVNQKNDAWFDFKVAPLGDKHMVVTDMFDDWEPGTEVFLFKGKGLPEALIIEAQRVYLDKIIMSDTGDALWSAGRIVWQRLVDRGLARYDSRVDRYILER